MTESKRKLIFCWTYRELGGAQIYLMAIMKAAVAEWDVLVILPRSTSLDLLGFLNQMGVRCEFVDSYLDLDPAPTITRKIQRQFRRIHAEFSIFRLLMRYNLKESILHIETAPWQSWILLTALAFRRANIFLNLHNALPPASAWREAIWKLRLQFVSRLPGFHIFTSNKDTKEKFKGWVANTFWEKIKVVYTSIDPDEIALATATPPDRSDLRGKYSIDKDKFVVLCVGQFIDRKGRWVFLDAAKAIEPIDPEVLFLWLTPKSPDELDLERIRSYELQDTFRLVLSETVGGSREDILAFFRVADIFSLASFVEGVPGSLLEAMAIGIPSISTSVNAIPEAIKDGETGLLIEPGKPEQLVAAILKLKSDKDLLEKLSSDGREFVLSNFNQHKTARIAIDAYKECFSDDG